MEYVYANLILKGMKTMNDVPKMYKKKVQALLDKEGK